MITDKLAQIWKAHDLRNNLLFVLAMLALYRFIAHVPVPGVDQAALQDIFNGNQILGLLNIFSGGSMQNFSIVMMGIAPCLPTRVMNCLAKCHIMQALHRQVGSM